jgi:flagellin-like hook-associated protein FlgL
LSNRINTYNKIINSSLQKLSTGKRINSAADSPSDILRISRFEAEVRGSQVAQRNIQDGISFLQVAESALSQMQQIGHRLRELSVQYNSDILTAEDKKMIENEAKELLKEMNYIIENTRFGELKVFEKNSYIIQTGPYSGDTYEIKLPDLSELKDICINSQQDSPPTDNDGTGNIDDNNNGNVGDIGDNNDNGDVGGIGDDNNGNVGGVGDGDNDDNDNIGGIGDNDDNGNVGDVGDGSNNDDGIGGVGNDNDDNGDVGGIGDDDNNCDNGDTGNVEDNNDDGGVGGIGDGNNSKDPSLNGYQKLYNQQGVLIYDGYMRNGEYHGYGKLYSNDGVLLYDGYWNDGIYHHYGKLYNEQGQIIYEGYWDNGKKQGYGKLFYSNGQIKYEGNWYNDLYHGWGKSFKENGQLEYEGEWVNGVPKTIINTGVSGFSLLSMPNTASIANETGLSLSTNIQNTLKPLNTSDDKNIYEKDSYNTNIQGNQNIVLLSEDNSGFEEINISDILKDDFIDKNILKPINSAVSHIGVMENTLSLRLDSQIRNEALKGKALSDITDVDVAKELMNYIKNQILIDTNISLLHQNLSNQRQYILKLLS